MSSNNTTPRLWIPDLLTVDQLIESNGVDPATLMPQLRIDLETALPLTLDPLEEQQWNDLSFCLKEVRKQRMAKGRRIHLYYWIYRHILELKLTKTVPQIHTHLARLSNNTSQRNYRIANRIGQLIDALGHPTYRNFGILTPDLVYRMKKIDWDRLCDYATTVIPPVELISVEQVTEASL